MGILRTDKVSGLETPTAVTGSVVFDGNNDDLQIADSNDFTFAKNDFTIEFWRYKQALAIDTYVSIYGSEAATRTFWFGQGSDGAEQFYWYHDSNTRSISSSPYPINTWSHLAAVRYNGTMTLYVDGVEAASTTSNVDVTINDTTENLVIGSDAGSAYDYQGYISNLRILNGTALYTSEFTPPVHELEVIGDTVLLCCNNSDSAGAEGTGKSITVNNNAAASTFSPGLTKDFTFGTEFRGVTTFDTQGYFVPPSGTTEQRGRGRGLFGGGQTPSPTNSIDYIQIQTQGNAQDFGDLTLTRHSLAAAASATRGLFGGGDPGTNVINFVTIASTGDAVDFGDLVAVEQDLGGAANNTRGLFFGGSPGENTIQYVTIASLGNAQDFGDLTRDERDQRGCGSPTRCIIFERDASIDFVTFATTGNGTDFGDTIAANNNISACSDSTRGIRTGGGPTNEYITIATLGNSQNFGSLTASSTQGHAVSDSKRGVISLGDDGNRTNAMDYITIQTTGNAQDFGDLTSVRDNGASSSDSHGSIS